MVSRRAFLATAVGGVAGALAGCQSNQQGPQLGRNGGAGTIPDGNVPTSLDPTQYADRFDEVVNAVGDLGADNSGEQSINGIINSALTSNRDTLLYLPRGTYKMTAGFRLTGGTNNLGIIGDNAVIRHGRVDSIRGHTVREGEYRGGTRLFNIGTPSSPHSGEFIMGGLVFDWSWSENAGMQGLNLHTTGHAEVENVRFHGLHSLGTHGSIRAATLADDATALFRNISMPQGGLHWHRTINDRNTEQRYGPNRPGPSWSTSGFTIGSEQRGTMVLDRVHTGPWPDNGLYLKGGTRGNPIGRKILRNCVAYNSNVSNIRVNSGPNWDPVPWIDGNSDDGPAYDRTTIEACRVVLNNTPDELTFGTQHGIRLDDGDPELRNSEVVLAHNNGHGIRVGQDTNSARVRDVTVNVHTPQRAIAVSGANPIIRGTTISLHDDISRSRVLSGVSAGAGIAIQQAQQDDST